jgi:hypothetical protein
VIQNDNVSNEILSLYTYFNYQNLLKSLLLRKQGHITVAENSS